MIEYNFLCLVLIKLSHFLQQCTNAFQMMLVGECKSLLALRLNECSSGYDGVNNIR